jgi:cysteine desulfurase
MNTLPKYYDAAATTPVDKRVLEAMLPYFSEIFGNASSNHDYGKKAKYAIENARLKVAELINADKGEIFFTSGATEAINWAIKGFLEENIEKGNHIITVKTEHKAVLNTCEYLETKGYEVTYLDVDSNGLISTKELLEAIKPNTILISVMYVNNEIGIIQDIKTIGKIAKEHGIVFFCDATQAVGKIPVDVVEDNIDMLCLSGHKFSGPKGIGALYIKNGTQIAPLIHGGGQEKGLRGGTYNTPLIVGLGEAANIAKEEFLMNFKSLMLKRSKIETYITANNIGTINFTNQNRAPHIISLSLLNNKTAEEFLIEKNKEFIASTGSACNSGIIEESHVYKALISSNSKSIVRISII